MKEKAEKVKEGLSKEKNLEIEKIDEELKYDDEVGEEVNDDLAEEVEGKKSLNLLLLPIYLKAPSKVILQEIPVQV